LTFGCPGDDASLEGLHSMSVSINRVMSPSDAADLELPLI